MVYLDCYNANKPHYDSISVGLRVLEQPWQASEFDPRKHFCTSSIITDFDAV